MEQFKQIKGFEGFYEVSDLGNIMSVDRVIIVNNNGTICSKRYKGRLIKPYKTRSGYLVVELVKQGIRKKLLVHRLVAEHFIINKENKPDLLPLPTCFWL